MSGGAGHVTIGWVPPTYLRLTKEMADIDLDCFSIGEVAAAAAAACPPAFADGRAAVPPKESSVSVSSTAELTIRSSSVTQYVSSQLIAALAGGGSIFPVAFLWMIRDQKRLASREHQPPFR